MKIIGLSAFYHDSAASLIIDGQIICAIEEEKFSRIKHDSTFPIQSLKFCLESQNLNINQIDAIVFYEKPILKFDRILTSFLQGRLGDIFTFAKVMPDWIRNKLFIRTKIQSILQVHFNTNFKNIFFSKHHLSHAASAFYPSPFDHALILCLDGVGEWSTTTIWKGSKEKIELLNEIEFPHSLGLFYSAFTGYLGFKVNSGEYKLMGLASYGSPVFADKIRNEVIQIFEDGSYALKHKFFNFNSTDQMWTSKLETLLGFPPRNPESEILNNHKNLAASVQSILEEVVLNLIKKTKQAHPELKNLTMAGGVALNCTLNGKIKSSSFFDNVFIQPAATDAGGAIGAALAYHYSIKGSQRISSKNSMKGALLGPKYSNQEILNSIQNYGLKYYFIEDLKALSKIFAQLISEQKVVALFQGNSEFGPRALGSRSILADPRNQNMQEIINSKIKRRESFRPFAPSILVDHFLEFFEGDLNTCDEFMLFTTKILNRNLLPATTHADMSSRVQIVREEVHPQFYNYLKAFYQLTKCPCLINTSFNVRGEPLVLSPSDAIRCFMTTDIDAIILENYLLLKNEQTDFHQFIPINELD